MPAFHFFTSRPQSKYRFKFRSFAVATLVAFSLGWTLLDWSRFHLLRERASQVALLGGGLAITEAAFIAGALIMVTSIGVEITEHRRLRDWIRRARYAKREIRQIAGQTIQSKVFGIGFWLNFIGAVGTSILLIAAVFWYVPIAGWGLLIALSLDLFATFGWRVPLHQKRRRLARNSKIIVRRARPADIDTYLKLQAERWDEDTMAQRDQLESRMRYYPQGMLVAERAGEIVGMVTAVRVTDYDYKNPPSWNEITRDGYCDNADPKGKVIFGVDLSTAKGVGHLAGDELLVGIGRLVISEGVKTALLGGRMPGYHAYANKMSAEEYLRAKDEHGEPLDHQIKYYTSVAGLKAVKVLPNYFNDPDSHNYGVLLRWRNPLYGLPLPKLWGALFPWLFRLEEAYLAYQKRRQPIQKA